MTSEDAETVFDQLLLRAVAITEVVFLCALAMLVCTASIFISRAINCIKRSGTNMKLPINLGMEDSHEAKKDVHVDIEMQPVHHDEMNAAHLAEMACADTMNRPNNEGAQSAQEETESDESEQEDAAPQIEYQQTEQVMQQTEQVMQQTEQVMQEDYAHELPPLRPAFIAPRSPVVMLPPKILITK